jgi:vancomycin permeability regulator SanA
MFSGIAGKVFRRYVLLWVIALLGLIALACFSYIQIHSFQSYQVADMQDIDQRIDNDPSVGLVFGAAITPEGEPRSVLRERLKTAYRLYQNRVIDYIHVSGYNDTINNDYNEPQAMVNYLVASGVSREDISVDSFGDSTFMTCQNARQVFSIDEAILITQSSHMNRALYSCHHFGIQAYGYSAETVDSSWNYWHQTIRETFGNIKVVLESRTQGRL